MLVDKQVDEVRDGLLAGEGVLVSEVFSNRTGLGEGDIFRVRLRGEEFKWPILGIARDYRTRGGAVFMDFGYFQKVTGSRAWGGVRFFFKDRDNLEASVRALRRQIILCCAVEHPLEILRGTQLRREVLEIFDETFAVTAVLLLIALCVAGLGIAGTLAVLVMERRRQLNTLVAIGADQSQLQRMVLWEGVLMVAAGEGIGLMGGFCLSWLLIYVINPQSFGWTFLYRVDWVALAVSFPLILTAALLAALPAARGVIRLSPAGVLKVS
jgi:putative ABC transport system permease protein